MPEKSGEIGVIPARPAPVDPARTTGERDMLLAYLDYYRAVLIRKCSELTGDKLDVTIADSTLTLGRLLRHMSLVEDHWFSFVLHGREPDAAWSTADWEAHPDWEMDTAADYSPGELGEQFDEAVAKSCAAVEGFDLDRIAERDGLHGPTSLRWILIHMIEEYARHCGHADLLREAIDGRVGD